MARPSPTPTVSFKKDGMVHQPEMGEFWVGVGEGVSPCCEAMAMERSSWNGSVVTSTLDIPRACNSGAASAMFSKLLSPPTSMMADRGTPILSRYIAPDSDSVYTSPGSL